MSDIRTTDRDVSRAIRSWLHEDRHEDASRLAGAVLDQVEATPQRRSTWWPARRTPIMTKFVTIGLAAAAVVVFVFIGAQLFGSPTADVGGPSDPTATPQASVADPTPDPPPSSTPWTGIPQGPFVVTGAGDPVQITIDIQSPGWSPLAEFDAVTKDDDGLNSPDTVGGALMAWSWPAGTEFLVYEDPCRWLTTIPETPATTPEEIAAAFTAQAETDATEPIDISVGGYAGKAVTVHVPMTYDLPDATRDEEFAACDNASFVFYSVEGAGSDAGESTGDARGAQGPGQVDELWILDVEGSLVILDAAYSPATPTDLVEELRALAKSATFEVP